MEWTFRRPYETVISAIGKIGGLLAVLRIIGFLISVYHSKIFRKDLKSLLVTNSKQKDKINDNSIVEGHNLNISDSFISK